MIENTSKGGSTVALALRFLIELLSLAAVAYWGFSTHSDLVDKLLFGIGLPVLMAAAWGIFRVDNDPKKAPVRVPGTVRLLLEVIYFGLGVWGLYAAGQLVLALAFAFLVLISYWMLLGRLLWLVKQ